MFNLDEHVADWRRQMQAAGITAPKVLDELEAHLRDEMEKNIQVGMNASQAFDSARQLIGPASALKFEFNKVAADKFTRQRKWKGRLIYGVAGFYLAMGMFISAFNRGGEMIPVERLLAFAALAVGAALLVSWRQAVRFLPAIASERIRAYLGFALLLPTFGWLAFFAYGILPRFDFTQGEVAIVVLWSLAPVSAVVGALGFALEEAASPAFGNITDQSGRGDQQRLGE